MRLASLLLANGFKSLRDPPIVRTVAVKGERNDRREVQSSIEHSVSRRPARNDLVPKDVKNLVFVRGLSWVTGVCMFLFKSFPSISTIFSIFR
jgi:hypothetical protein